MTNLINQSFFVGDLFIPNLAQSADLTKLNDFIVKYEPECLLKVLGYPLYKLVGVESSQRMTELMNGAEYTDGEGELRKWQGIVHSTESFIAAYVFWKHQKATKEQTTGTGTVIKKPTAGIIISPADKMTTAWNFYSDEVYNMTHFLWLKKDVSGDRSYPEFKYHQFVETRRIARRIDNIFEL